MIAMLAAIAARSISDADGRSGVCHRTCLKPGSAPTPPLMTRADVAGNANVQRPRCYPPVVSWNLLLPTVGQVPRHGFRERSRYRDLDL